MALNTIYCHLITHLIIFLSFIHVYWCCSRVNVVVCMICLAACPVLSCPVLSCPVLSCPVLSCPVLSCPVLSCPVLTLGHVLQCHADHLISSVSQLIVQLSSNHWEMNTMKAEPNIPAPLRSASNRTISRHIFVLYGPINLH